MTNIFGPNDELIARLEIRFPFFSFQLYFRKLLPDRKWITYSFGQSMVWLSAGALMNTFNLADMTAGQNRILLQCICGILIFFFTYAAFSKLLDYVSFQSSLASLPMGGEMAGLIAIGLLLAECLAVFLLVHPRTQRAGLYLSLALMIIFIAYVGYMTLFASKCSCSCGGVLNGLNWQQHLALNIVLCGFAISGIRLKLRQQNEAHASFLSDQ